MMDDRTNFIRITNHNKSVTGRFNGKDYLFATGKPVDVPELVARHVFAFGLEDKTAALNRLGWARTSDEIEAGLEKLGKVTFEDPPEMIEAPRKGKRTGTAGPPVNAGGSEDGAMDAHAFNAPSNGPMMASGEDGGF
jgi:hypothetical protein